MIFLSLDEASKINNSADGNFLLPITSTATTKKDNYHLDVIYKFCRKEITPSGVGVSQRNLFLDEGRLIVLFMFN